MPNVDVETSCHQSVTTLPSTRVCGVQSFRRKETVRQSCFYVSFKSGKISEGVEIVKCPGKTYKRYARTSNSRSVLKRRLSPGGTRGAVYTYRSRFLYERDRYWCSSPIISPTSMDEKTPVLTVKVTVSTTRVRTEG